MSNINCVGNSLPGFDQPYVEELKQNSSNADGSIELIAYGPIQMKDNSGNPLPNAIGINDIHVYIAKEDARNKLIVFDSKDDDEVEFVLYEKPCSEDTRFSTFNLFIPYEQIKFARGTYKVRTYVQQVAAVVGSVTHYKLAQVNEQMLTIITDAGMGKNNNKPYLDTAFKRGICTDYSGINLS